MWKALKKLRVELFVLLVLIFVIQWYFSSNSSWVDYEKGDVYPVFNIKPGDHMMVFDAATNTVLFEKHFCTHENVDVQIGGTKTSYQPFEGGYAFLSDRVFGGIIVLKFADNTQTQFQLKKNNRISVSLRNNPPENCGNSVNL